MSRERFSSEIVFSCVLAIRAASFFHVSDRLLEQLEATAPNDKRWTALMSVAKESLEHHIKEEEDELFEKAKKAFDNKLATAMAEEFLDLKKSLLKGIKKGETPQQRTSHELVQKAA